MGEPPYSFAVQEEDLGPRRPGVSRSSQMVGGRPSERPCPKRFGERRPGGDAKLAVGTRDVVLHRLTGDEQGCAISGLASPWAAMRATRRSLAVNASAP